MEEMVSKEKIQVYVRLELKDYILFNYYFNKKMLTQVTVIGLIFLFSMIYLSFYSHGSINPTVMNFIYLIVAFILVSYFLVYYRAKKVWDSSSLITETKHYSFDEEGLSTESQTSSSKIGWDKIYKVIETKKLLLIYISNMQAFIIPKRLLDKDQYMSLISFVQKVEKKHLK